jgi:hypothetical protein
MRRPRWKKLAVLGAALGLIPALVACDDAPFGPERDRLAENRERWRSAGVSSYDYVFRARCFCGPDALQPVRIEVADGEVVSITSIETGEPAEPAFPGEALTVEGLFAFLAEALDDDPASFSASYDPDLGLPTSASIDFDARVADEEFGFEADDLRPLAAAARAAP